MINRQNFRINLNFAATNNWFRSPVYWLFALAMTAFLACYAFRPITGPDFWWHLKTGEVMWLNKGLLQIDPFTYTGDGLVTVRETLILQGYWLWQLLVYGAYKLGQFNGIFVFNLLTLFALFGISTWQLKQRGVTFLLAAPLLTLAFVLLSNFYYIERPQIVSFLCATLLLGLLHKVREGGRLGWSLPLLMLLWANMHGGFVVGWILLLLFSAGAVFEYRNQRQLLCHVLTWVAAALLASLLNPTGADVFTSLFNFYDTPMMNAVSEYQSTLAVFNKGRYAVVVLWLLIGLYVLGLWCSQRLYWPEIILALFLAWFSVMHLRNVAFFVFAMLPALGAGLQQGLNKLPSKKLLAPGLLMFFFAIAGLAVRGWDLRQEKLTMGSVHSFYPVAVVDFLQNSAVQGNMLNNYDFGGYLLWRLYPERRVFIDGRGMKPEVYEDWVAMSSASLDLGAAGKAKYQELLDRYGIDFVTNPLSLRDSGRITPLVKFLLNKPEWHPVYVDEQSYVLVRTSDKNQQVVEKFALDKRQFVEKMIAYLQQRINIQPNHVAHRVALAEMLIFYGKYDLAQLQIDMIRGLQPNNPEIHALMNQLAVLKG